MLRPLGHAARRRPRSSPAAWPPPAAPRRSTSSRSRSRSIRVDGEMTVLDGEATLSGQDVESLVLEVWPERADDAPATDGEWICGRARCRPGAVPVVPRSPRPGRHFPDHPGARCRRNSSGCRARFRALCAEPEGLILVTGPRASGKSTLISAFVDIINRTRQRARHHARDAGEGGARVRSALISRGGARDGRGSAGQPAAACCARRRT